jgi:hypothetical protein
VTINVRENRGQSRMDNPETLATLSVKENMGQSRMDNPETLATLSVRENRGQSRMDNPETLVTLNVRENRGQSRMDNPETLATLSTQNTGRTQNKTKNNTTQHRKLKRSVTRILPKTGGEPWCARRLGSSFFL